MTTDETAEELPPHTAPESITINVRGAIDPASVETLAHTVAAYVRSLSRHIDLASLDGLTIAADYDSALLELDRGYETTHKLTASKGEAIGVAMTPTVLRDGVLRSHIVLSYATALMVQEHEGESFGLGIHLLAHECAHVEITNRFDRAFPNVLLRKKHFDALEGMRWQTITACWDEYAACWIGASFGEDNTSSYEQTFLSYLASTRGVANGFIKAYRLHGDVLRVMGEVFGAYGTLMKFACYLMGNMVGREITLTNLPKTTEALKGHWFERYFERLWETCAAIRSEYGDWKDTALFGKLGDLLEEIVVEGGLTATSLGDGNVYVDMPFTPETTPG